MNNYKQRKANLYNPKSSQPFTISRSKIDRFLECPRCFYLDRRMGLDRPRWPGWPLNSAVDQLLKNEFDLLRQDGSRHQLMEEYNIDAVPFKHRDLPTWRGDLNRFTGAKVLHKPTNLIIDGIIDDVWINPKGQLHIVDYKATSTKDEISLDDEHKQGFKKQMEVYQWIFRQMGFDVSNVGYFVYANGIKDNKKFDGILEFELSILEHQGDDSWVEPTIFEIKECLDGEIPSSSPDCEYCTYHQLIDENLGNGSNL